MRFISFKDEVGRGLCVAENGSVHGHYEHDREFPGWLEQVLAAGLGALVRAGETLRTGRAIDLAHAHFLPPLMRPPKILCVGLNYRDHSAESGFKQPDYPTLFGRFASSLIGHRAPLIRPSLSHTLDYEGELAAVIGIGGRHIPLAAALDHVAGYAIFNEGSVRDYQFKAPQWTMGKNFDGTGAFGPEFVTADELLPGAAGLRIETRLNGAVMQSASTDDMVFDVSSLVAIISEAITLEPGDVIVTGTPSGVGAARKPPVFLQPGDVCEVEIERLGILSNPVEDEAGARREAA